MDDSDLKALAAAYIRSLKVRNLTERTIDAVSWKLDRFRDYLESCGVGRVDRITARHVRDYQMALYERLNRQGRPNTVAYQNGLLSTARQFLRFLKENDYIVSDPGIGVAYAKVPKRLPRGVLTPSEARKIIHAPDITTAIG